MSVEMGTAVGYLDLDTSRFTQGLISAQSELSGFNSNSSNMTGTLNKLSKGMVSTGETLTKSVTVPIVSAGTGIVATSAKFESGLSKVAAISGATGDQMEQLKQKAIEMGAKTTFSASESADAFSYMASAGWSTNEMLDGIQGVMTLASASGEDLATTSDICTNSMTAFGMKADETQRFVDVLAQTSNATNADVSSLGEAFQYVAPVAGALKYSVEDVSVALGIMANNGIKGSTAGTSLRAMLTNLISPTDEVKGAMDNLHLTMTDSTGAMKPFSEIMIEMRKGFSGMTDDQKAATAASIAGKEGMSGLLSIMNASDDTFNSLTQQINNSSGAAQQMSDTMNDNLKGDFTQLGGQIETVTLQFGDILLPMLKDVVNKLSDVATWIQNLDEPQRRMIVTIAGIAASVGPILIILGKFLGSISTISGAVTALGPALAGIGTAFTGVIAPVLAVIAVIGAIIGLFVYLYNTNENVRNALNSAWESIKNSVSSAIEKIQQPLQRVGQAFNNLLQVLQPIFLLLGTMIVTSFGTIVGIINGLIQALAPLLDAFGNVVDFIANVIGIIVSLFTGDLDGAWNHLKGAVGDLVNFIKNIFLALWEFIKGFVSGFLGTIQTALGMFGINIKQVIIDIYNAVSAWVVNMVNKAIEMGTNFITNIINFFTQLPGNILNFITEAFNFIVSWDTMMVNKAIEMGTNFLNSVVSFFTQLPERIGYFIGFALGTIIKWDIDMVNKAIEMGTNFINAIVNFFTQLPTNIYNFITAAFNFIVSWDKMMVNKAIELGTNFLNNIINFFTQLPGNIYNFITNAYNNVVNWVGNMGSQASNAGSNFINNVINYISQLPGNVWNWLMNVINNVSSWANNMVNTASSGMSSFVSTVINTISSLPGRVYEIGSNIVRGIWNGISDMAGWIGDQISGFTDGVISGFKNALGIHSPSRKAMPIGMYTAQGFGVGLVNEMSNVKGDIKSSVDDALDIKPVLNADVDTTSLGKTSSAFSNISNKTAELAKSTTDNIKVVFTSLSDWFSEITDNISQSIDSISNKFNDFKDMASGTTLSLQATGTGYTKYNSFSDNQSNDNTRSKETDSTKAKSEGDTFIFNSPTAIDEIEAAKQLKKAKKEIIEGF